MERQAMVEDTGLRDLAANIEDIIIAACCTAEAAPVASADVRAPGSSARVTWAAELEEVREFGAAESHEGAGGMADCEDDDDEEFVDCVELLPAPNAETRAAIASLRAVIEVRPGEPGQCDVPALGSNHI
jgi:hypothetical protein